MFAHKLSDIGSLIKFVVCIIFVFICITLATTTTTTTILQLPLGRYVLPLMFVALCINFDFRRWLQYTIPFYIPLYCMHIVMFVLCVSPSSLLYPIVVFNFVHAFFVHFYIRWEDWRSSFRYRYHYLKIDMLLIYLILPPKQ